MYRVLHRNACEKQAIRSDLSANSLALANRGDWQQSVSTDSGNFYGVGKVKQRLLLILQLSCLLIFVKIDRTLSVQLHHGNTTR